MKAHNWYYVFFDADAIEGQSGAPILSSDGRAIGIFAQHDGVEEKAPVEEYAAAGGKGPSATSILQQIASSPFLEGSRKEKAAKGVFTISKGDWMAKFNSLF